MKRRVVAHGGRRRLSSYAWERLLCAVLAACLAVAPLQALGADAAVVAGDVPVAMDAQPVSDAAAPAEDSDDETAAIADEAADGCPDTEAAGMAEAAGEEGAVPSAPSEGGGDDQAAQDAPGNGLDADAVPDASPDEPGESLPAEAAADAGAAGAELAAGGEGPGNPEGPEDMLPTESDGAPAAETALQAPPAQVSGTSAQASSSHASYQPTLAPVMGAVPLLVVVAGFLGADGAGAVAYSDTYDWAATVFDAAGGVSAYYTDMSGGKFTFVPAAETSAHGVDGNTNAADAENDGVVHVNLPEAHGNWGGAYYSDGAVAGAMLQTFARILLAADAYVDFASFDADADGVLSTDELAIAFVVAGYEAATGQEALPAGSYSLWSHAWAYSDAGIAAPRLDGVAVDDYIAIAETMRGERAGKEADVQEPLAVLVHELGHYLGLPDLYDTTGASGDWEDHAVDSASLMGAGNWASVTDAKGNVSYVPVALDAWSRYQLGWTTPTVVTKSGVYTVSSQDSKRGYTTLLIPTKHAGEYYLIENRTFTGHDAGLASEYDDYKNGGIVIWHIDNGMVERYLASNTVNGSAHRPGVAPLYPEEDDESWNYTLTYKSSVPDTTLLFWSKSVWNTYFKGKDALDLPLYGKGKKANDPLKRLLSGIRIQFLTGSGPDMRIRITMPGDELPGKKKDAPKPAAPAVQAEYVPDAIPATGDDAPIAPVAALAVASLALLLFAKRTRRV